MYKANDIKEGLFGLIGWRQDHTPDFDLDDTLTVTLSGKYFQDEHALLTLSSIRAIAPDFKTDAEFSQWLELKTKAGIIKAIDMLYGREVTDKDITKHIISQKMLFADIISKQVTVDMLREFACNPNFRINRATTNISTLEVRYELDGDSTSERKSGLAYRLDLAYEAIGKKCLPKRINGISIGSMT